MKILFTTFCAVFLYSCQGKSNNNYSHAERSIINYLTQKLGKDAYYEPISFGKTDTIYVKDTFNTYLNHLHKELVYDSIAYIQVQKNHKKYQNDSYSDKLLYSCAAVLDKLSMKKKLIQKELDSLKMILPDIPQTSIAYFQLSHQYKYARPIKKNAVNFTLDANAQVMESRLLADIRGENGRITIQQRPFADEEGKRTCDGRVLRNLRLNGVLLPLDDKRRTLKVKPGIHVFSWQLPYQSFNEYDTQQPILVTSGQRYFFVGTYERIYTDDKPLFK